MTWPWIRRSRYERVCKELKATQRKLEVMQKHWAKVVLDNSELAMKVKPK